MRINSINSPSFGHMKCTREQYLNIRLNLPVGYDDWRIPGAVTDSRAKHINISPNNDVFICDEEKGEKEFHKIGNSESSLCENFLKAFKELFPEKAQECERRRRTFINSDDSYDGCGFSAAANWNYPGCYSGFSGTGWGCY